jgi:hypothetical protein
MCQPPGFRRIDSSFRELFRTLERQGIQMVVELKARITRRELYEKIWGTSLARTAKEVRLAAGTLRDICKNHSIPVPPRGFFLRLGPKLQTPLPELSGWNPNVIELFGQAESRRRLQHRKPEGIISVPEAVVARRGPFSHPFTARTRRFLARAKPDLAGILVSGEGLVAHVRVSKRTLPRALRILDALFLALDQEPFRLSWPEGSDARLTISVLDDTFRFAISEIIHYARHRPTSRERLQQKQNWAFRPRKSDYKLTGRLRLEIDGVQGRRRHHAWSDGSRPLEVCLREFLVALVGLAQDLGKERTGAGSWRACWDRHQALEKQLAAKQSAAVHRIDLVTQTIKNRESAKALREFLAVLELALPKIEDVEQRRQGQELAAWIARRADALDPVMNMSRLLADFKAAAT